MTPLPIPVPWPHAGIAWSAPALVLVLALAASPAARAEPGGTSPATTAAGESRPDGTAVRDTAVLRAVRRAERDLARLEGEIALARRLRTAQDALLAWHDARSGERAAHALPLRLPATLCARPRLETLCRALPHSFQAYPEQGTP